MIPIKDNYKFFFVGQLRCVHVLQFIGERHLWDHPYFMDGFQDER